LLKRLRWFRLAADQGYAEAQNFLGLMYAKGQGVPADPIRAHMWLSLAAAQNHPDAAKHRDGRRGTTESGAASRGRQARQRMETDHDGVGVCPIRRRRHVQGRIAAYGTGDYQAALRLFRPLADQGNMTAQYNLALMFSQGKGAAKDDAEAAKWYRLAADQGYADAQTKLGYMYANGLGVSQSHADAMKWYRLAADQGDGSAQLNLGIMYQAGQGTPKNEVLSYMWISLAVKHGNQRAVAYLNAIARTTTPAQIAEAEKLAGEWRSTKPAPQ
jgi:TPR repeat protein